MTPEAETALRRSIVERWEPRAAGKSEDSVCALCEIFDDCYGCPVAAKTRMPNCEGSPYWKYVRLFNVATENDDKHPERNPDVMRAAQAELGFLRSLLPKEEA